MAAIFTGNASRSRCRRWTSTLGEGLAANHAGITSLTGVGIAVEGVQKAIDVQASDSIAA